MIKLTDVSFQYPNSDSPVLDHVNLRIQPATINLVTGASGSGKSTLLRCINGLVPHFSGGHISGKITVFGQQPIASGPAGMANIVGFVFQDPESQSIYDVVEDEIAFRMENEGTPRSLMHKHMDDICQKLHIEGLRKKRIQNLSGGEKQLVAIASVLVGSPSVVILDEPTSQLDPRTADELLKVVVRLKEEFGLTVLISEHRLERLLPFTDQLIYLPEKGSLQIGSPEEILEKMTLVPPIVEIARKLKVTPLPISINEFPKIIVRTVAPAINPTNILRLSHNSPILRINNLSFKIGNQPILIDIDLDLYQGEILALLGPNGAGKSTFLRSILGFTNHTGEINKENDPNPYFGEIAYLPQNPNDLLFAETILDELQITLKNHNKVIDNEGLIKFLKQFDLADKKEQYPRDLSVGERQRTALSAITVHDPPIIFLDEPTRGLDYANKKSLVSCLSTWRDNGKAILVVTHDVEFAAQLADRVAILEQGKMIFQGSPKKAFTQFPTYRTQTAKLFPTTTWIVPEDITI